MSSKMLLFLRILLNNKNFLIADIIYKINQHFKERETAAYLIQESFKNYLFEKQNLADGFIKFPCGTWSNGAQCICDECCDWW